MSTPFDADAIFELGWRQGAVLGPKLAERARACAPDGLEVKETDWLVVTSHDCDVVSQQIDKEPVVEILRLVPVVAKGADKQRAGGRNPRLVQIVVEGQVFDCNVHHRWTFRRECLASEMPRAQLPDKERRLIAEWLAKRYIRAAFPSAFDARWRREMKGWTTLLQKWSAAIQGIYLRLNTLDELADGHPYRCDFLVAAPAKNRVKAGWADAREAIAQEIETFWRAFSPGIVVDEVEVLGTDEITLAQLDGYQRFDADWVSFADETDTIPLIVDMTS